MWRCTVSVSPNVLPLKGCVTPCKLGNVRACEKNITSMKRRRNFTKQHGVTFLPIYTLSPFYQTTRSHSSTKLHAVSPNKLHSHSYQTTRCLSYQTTHSLPPNYTLSLLPNYTLSLLPNYRVTPTKLHAVSPTKL